MKKQLIQYLLLTFLATNLFGQEFSFSLYFEDAAGNKDTLILGYDDSATNDIDIAFGEIDISNIPFDSVFEVRVSNPHNFYSPISFFSKKQIQKKDCLSESFPFVNFIHFKCSNFPVIVRWDKSLFEDECRTKSLITDWYPGLWFDATHGSEHGPVYLHEHDSIIFSYPSKDFYFIYTFEEKKDTLNVVYLAIASNNNQILNVIDYKKSEISFNNPTQDILSIKSKNNDIKSVILYSIEGKKVLSTPDYKCIDVSFLKAGIYIIQVSFQHFAVIDKLLIIR